MEPNKFMEFNKITHFSEEYWISDTFYINKKKDLKDPASETIENRTENCVERFFTRMGLASDKTTSPIKKASIYSGGDTKNRLVIDINGTKIKLNIAGKALKEGEKIPFYKRIFNQEITILGGRFLVNKNSYKKRTANDLSLTDYAINHYISRNFSDFVFDAARKGDGELIKELLSKRGSTSDSDLGKAVKIAAQKGDIAVIKELLSDGRSISENDLNFAVKNAAQKGDIAVIKELLSNGRSISENDLREAVFGAARKGDIPVISELLSNGRSISQNDLNLAATIAAENSHFEFIMKLLSDGRSVSKEVLSTLRISAKKRHKEILEGKL